LVHVPLFAWGDPQYGCRTCLIPKRAQLDWWIGPSELAATRDGITGTAAKPDQPPAMRCKKCVRDEWQQDVHK